MRLPDGKILRKYTITIAVGALFSWVYLANQKVAYGPLGELPREEQLRQLCDVFSIPGMLFLLAGLLMTVANEGALDGIGYLGHYMYHMLVPGKRASTKRYGDYVTQKRGSRVSGYGFLYVVGGISLAVGVVFYALFKLSA